MAPDEILQSHSEATYSRLNATPRILAVQDTTAATVYTARAGCPTTHLIRVGAREADGYDVLVAPRPVGVALLIRASWNRCVNTPQR